MAGQTSQEVESGPPMSWAVRASMPYTLAMASQASSVATCPTLDMSSFAYWIACRPEECFEGRWQSAQGGGNRWQKQSVQARANKKHMQPAALHKQETMPAF